MFVFLPFYNFNINESIQRCIMGHKYSTAVDKCLQITSSNSETIMKPLVHLLLQVNCTRAKGLETLSRPSEAASVQCIWCEAARWVEHSNEIPVHLYKSSSEAKHVTSLRRRSQRKGHRVANNEHACAHPISRQSVFTQKYILCVHFVLKKTFGCGCLYSSHAAPSTQHLKASWESEIGVEDMG